jgi:outer membrane receptor protein involved in Fe transport
MKLSFYFLLITYFISPFSLASQKSISGNIKDSDGSPIIGANISCGYNGTVSDVEGNYTIAVDENCLLIVAYPGYKSIEKRSDEISSPNNITMVIFEEQLDQVVVTASKFEQRISESTVSVDIIKPDLIKSANAVKVDAILDKVPGVQMINGQANIRGGSGFSYGAGSRVMVLFDDMPFLQMDIGLANWADLPIEAVGQVEVVKGASSALYGSSALNGIIHFRSQKVGAKPITNVFASYTAFQDPKEIKYKWWDETYKPQRLNIGLSHISKLSSKLTLSASGAYLNQDSYNKDTYERRARGAVNLKYALSERLSIGLNTMVNKNENSDFFIWRNALRGIYSPFDGTVSFGTRTRINTDPYIHYFAKNGITHKLNTRYYFVNNENNNNQSNKSQNYYTEYSLAKTFESKQLYLVGGIMNNITDAEAELFDGKSYLYRNTAAYAQADKKFGDKLSISAGLRYEYNLQNSPDSIPGFIIPGGKVEDDQVIARLGLNYKLSEYSGLRMSWGQGYRYPTITERFIRTTFGGFKIVPNPLLQPEYGWSAEIGIKQGFKLSSFKGYLDLSAFNSEYEDMIEFTFLERDLAFRPINIGNTRISGFEAAINGQFQIWKIPISILTGYTYINPIYKNFNDNPDIKENISTAQNVLKYRTKHQAKIDAEASYKFLSIGFSSQFNSHMINIDGRFEEPLEGVDLFAIQAFRNINNKGYNLLDARASIKYKGAKMTFLINNFKNIAYTVRPGLLEAPKNMSLRLDYTF